MCGCPALSKPHLKDILPGWSDVRRRYAAFQAVRVQLGKVYVKLIIAEQLLQIEQAVTYRVYIHIRIEYIFMLVGMWPMIGETRQL